MHTSAAGAKEVNLVAREVGDTEALAALFDGRDAIAAVMELQGLPVDSGRRARVRNLMPQYAAAVDMMTAKLPVAIAAAYPPVENLLTDVYVSY